MIKVGIRDVNLPRDEEKIALIDHLIKDYGGNHIDEIPLAFEMALAGKLDITEDEVDAKENFSCLYVSRIMNSYRRWARKEIDYLPVLPGPGNRLLENRTTAVSWGEFVQREYEHYLSFGPERRRIWPPELYDQLVQDKFIRPDDYYRSLMPTVRDKMISDLKGEKFKIGNGNYSALSKSRREFAESISRTNIAEIDRKISDYATGSKNAELELAAKQISVLKFFQAAKANFVKQIYKREE